MDNSIYSASPVKVNKEILNMQRRVYSRPHTSQTNQKGLVENQNILDNKFYNDRSKIRSQSQRKRAKNRTENIEQFIEFNSYVNETNKFQKSENNSPAKIDTRPYLLRQYCPPTLTKVTQENFRKVHSQYQVAIQNSKMSQTLSQKLGSYLPIPKSSGRSNQIFFQSSPNMTSPEKPMKESIRDMANDPLEFTENINIIMREYENSHKKFLENLNILKNLKDDINVMHTYIMDNLAMKSNHSNNAIDSLQHPVSNGFKFDGNSHINPETSMFNPVDNKNKILYSNFLVPEKISQNNLNSGKFSIVLEDIRSSRNDSSNINNSDYISSNNVIGGLKDISLEKNPNEDLIAPYEEAIQGTLLYDLEKMLNTIITSRKLKTKLTTSIMEEFMKKVILYYKIIIKDLSNMRQHDLSMMLLTLFKIITIQFEDMYASYFIQIELEKRNPGKKLLCDVLYYKDIAIEQNMYFESKEQKYQEQIRDLKKQLQETHNEKQELEQILKENIEKEQIGDHLGRNKVLYSNSRVKE